MDDDKAVPLAVRWASRRFEPSSILCLRTLTQSHYYACASSADARLWLTSICDAQPVRVPTVVHGFTISNNEMDRSFVELFVLRKHTMMVLFSAASRLARSSYILVVARERKLELSSRGRALAAPHKLARTRSIVVSLDLTSYVKKCRMVCFRSAVRAQQEVVMDRHHGRWVSAVHVPCTTPTVVTMVLQQAPLHPIHSPAASFDHHRCCVSILVVRVLSLLWTSDIYGTQQQQQTHSNQWCTYDTNRTISVYLKLVRGDALRT